MFWLLLQAMELDIYSAWGFALNLRFIDYFIMDFCKNELIKNDSLRNSLYSKQDKYIK